MLQQKRKSYSSDTQTIHGNKQLKTVDVLESVQKLAGKPVNQRIVRSILKTLKRQGFIKRTLLTSSNVPVLVWAV